MIKAALLRRGELLLGAAGSAPSLEQSLAGAVSSHPISFARLFGQLRSPAVLGLSGTISVSGALACEEELRAMWSSWLLRLCS